MDIRVEKLNTKILSQKASALGLKLPKDAEPKDMALAVSKALCDMYKDEVLPCGICGVETPDSPKLPSCPACGVWFEEKKTNGVPANGDARAEARALRKAEEASSVDSANPASRFEALNHAIHDAKLSIATQGWEIGTYLLEVHDKDLWKVAKHKSFDVYVEKEFKFSPQNAREMMRVAKVFRRDQIGDLHITHLQLISKIPDEKEREELLQDTKRTSPTKRELAQKVKKKRQEKGLTTERKGLEETVLVSARLKPGEVAAERWSKYERGVARGRFKIGDATFLLETKGKDGFRVILVKPKKGE